MLLKLNVSKRRDRHSKNFRVKPKAFLGLLIGVSAMCWFSYKQIKNYFEEPQALFVLGGAPEREVFAAEFARTHPNLPIWVSGGSNPEYSEAVFSEAGIDPDLVHLDYRAVDTVTNFTTLVDELEAQGIESIYLMTSEDHMLRARVIGEIVFGSRGINCKPVSVPSERSPEPLQKIIRDGARSVLWLTTGRTGATLSRVFEPTKNIEQQQTFSEENE